MVMTLKSLCSAQITPTMFIKVLMLRSGFYSLLILPTTGQHFYKSTAFDLKTETLTDDVTAFTLDDSSDFEYIQFNSEHLQWKQHRLMVIPM